MSAYLLLLLTSHFIVLWLSRNDPRTPSDEREILIGLRSRRVGYIARTALFVVAVFIMIHDEGHNWSYGHIVLSAIVVAELIKCGTQIGMFRTSS